MGLELGDLTAVRGFCDALLLGGDAPTDRDDDARQRPPPLLESLDALLLVAGVDGVRETGGGAARTAQGHEIHFGVNHLGHFALARAMLPLLRDAPRRSGGGRVIAVTSEACLDATPRLGDPAHWSASAALARGGLGGFDAHSAYADSKACNVLFADEVRACG